MKVISEEDLKDKLDIARRCHDHVRCQILYELLSECTELNPWLPIDENTPKDRQLLSYFPEYKNFKRCVRIDMFPVIGNSFGQPTHYQELPPDPIDTSIKK